MMPPLKLLAVDQKSDAKISIAIAAIVLFNMLRMPADFSMDSLAYLHFFEMLGNQTFQEVLSERLDFPYVHLNQTPPFEVGFVAIAKILSYITSDPLTLYALVAASSVGLRVFVMRKLRAPWAWVAIINVYAVTLFEANALRLGLAATVVLYAIERIAKDRRFGWALLASAPLFHLQVLFFALPFGAGWLFRKFISKTTAYGFIIHLVMIATALQIVALLPALGGEKIGEYIYRGGSGSAGVTVTSTLGALFLIAAALSTVNRRVSNQATLAFDSALSSAFLAATMLVTATQIAVLGDRAWQLSFLIIASLIFMDWNTKKRKVLPVLLLCLVSAISVVNVTLRYPLSNFFYPIFPEATTTRIP